MIPPAERFYMQFDHSPNIYKWFGMLFVLLCFDIPLTVCQPYCVAINSQCRQTQRLICPLTPTQLLSPSQFNDRGPGVSAELSRPGPLIQASWWIWLPLPAPNGSVAAGHAVWGWHTILFVNVAGCHIRLPQQVADYAWRTCSQCLRPRGTTYRYNVSL